MSSCRDCGRENAASFAETVPNRCRAYMGPFLDGVKGRYARDECAFAAELRHAGRYADVKPFVEELKRWRFAAWFPLRVLFGLFVSDNGLTMRVHARAYIEADDMAEPIIMVEQAFASDRPTRLSIDPRGVYHDFVREICDKLITDGLVRS